MKTKIRLSAGLLAIVMILSSVACPIFSLFSFADESGWTVKSPDGYTVMNIDLSDGGALTYTASQDGVTVVEQSDLGIVTSAGDFTEGLTYVTETDTVIDETYDVLSGKQSTYVNRANEKTVSFTKDGVQFDLIVRVYNDGIAFRYAITTADAQTMTVEPNAEITSFDMPAGSRFWYMPRTDKSFMYEKNYEAGKVGTTEIGVQPSMPMLYEVGYKYCLVTEADRHGTYTGSLLRLEANGELRTIFDLAQTSAVSTETPFVSPWRTVVIGSAAEIMQNTMVENLSPAPDEETYKFSEWVKPGLSSWSWVSYYGGQKDPEIHKHFIDLASDMEWEYYILDEEWQPKSGKSTCYYEGMWDWFEEVRDYANEKGVKLIAWVNKKDVDTHEERVARFKEWSEAGIVGIKVDFFYNDNQSTLQLYDELYKDAAEYRMMVNVHGGNPSSGEIRTYPNVITREAVRGQEQGGITAAQYTLIPFIRAAVGSSDVTEQLYSRDTNKTSMGFQIALSTLIENGIHSLGSKPEEYYSIPEAVSYYKDFPETWDELYVVDAVVGESVDVARRSGETWYAAGISVEEDYYTYTPSFLDPNQSYAAMIYTEAYDYSDADNYEYAPKLRDDLELNVIYGVSYKSNLGISVDAGGGYAIKFIPMGDDLVSLNADPSDLAIEVYYSSEVTLSTDPVDFEYDDVQWYVTDKSIASVSPKGNGAVIKGLKEGTTTVKAVSVYDHSVKAVINLTVTPPAYTFNDDDWDVINNNNNYIIKGESQITITAENGVIENNVFAMKAEDENFEITAKISGGLNANYQGGFLGVFANDLNPYVSVGRRYHTSFNSGGDTPKNHVAVMSNTSEQYVADPNVNGDVYVRLVKNGDNFTGYYRVNKTDAWTEAFTVTNAALADSEMYVGFYASCGGSTNGIDVTVSDFTYNGRLVKIADATANTDTFEAEDATVSGGVLVSNSEASGGYHVGNMGGGTNGTVTFTADSEFAGIATLRIYYATAQARKFSISVNGNATTVDCASTGGWNTVGQPIELEVTLKKGENTIVIGGADGAYAPNLDCIEVTYPEFELTSAEGSYEMEEGTLSGGADIVSAGDCSNGKRIGNVGGANNGSAAFEIASDIDTEATIKVYYATNGARPLSVTVNGKTYTVNCASTGTWNTTGAPVEIDVQLVTGMNTIVFGGVDGAWAPNLDKFEIELNNYDSAVGSYEMEDGKLSGSAVSLTKNGCSNGKRLGDVGGPDNGSATFEIEHNENGKVTLMVYYATNGDRPLGVTVNGKLYTVSCPSTGGWNAPGTPVAVTVELKKGVNTIVFGGVDGAYAPNLDKFEIVDAVLNTVTETIEMENGTVANGASVGNNANVSGGKRVGNVGGTSNGTVTFTVSSDAAGKSTISVYYATLQARKLNVTVNGKSYTVDCAATGGWNTVGTPVEIEVDLAAGENTIVFGGADGGWAPNLDKFDIEVFMYE